MGVKLRLDLLAWSDLPKMFLISFASFLLSAKGKRSNIATTNRYADSATPLLDTRHSRLWE
jgi:hypothetical protein